MWTIVMGDNDIDYVRSYGTFATESDAESKIARLHAKYPNYSVYSVDSGENVMRAVEIQDLTVLDAEVKDLDYP